MTDGAVSFRRATAADMPAIVRLLADDAIGTTREDASLPLLAAYTLAFEAIARDANQFLAVAIDGDAVVGTLQLSFVPGMSRKGMWRGQIEAVRVEQSHRSAGVGELFFRWAIERCADRGCGLVQLTTDKARPDAHRFYERLGFTATHEGFKLALAENSR